MDFRRDGTHLKRPPSAPLGRLLSMDSAREFTTLRGRARGGPTMAFWVTRRHRRRRHGDAPSMCPLGLAAATTAAAADAGVVTSVGAIGRMRDIDHGSDIVHMDVVRVHVGVDAGGNMLWRPIKFEIVADEVRHPDERIVVAGRPRETGVP